MKKLTKLLVLTMTLALSSCAQQSVVTAGDGQSAFSVDCSGALGGWQACYDKIGAICAAYGYEVIKSSLDGNVIRGKESSVRTILARCKK
jgi:hypothetical protein